MQYALLIYGEEKRWATMPQAEKDKEMEGYVAFGKEFSGTIKGGDALHPSTAATTVRLRNGKRLTTDGPFAETKEQLGGFYVVDAKDLDEAIAMAAKIPGARAGAVEVRPILTFS